MHIDSISAKAGQLEASLDNILNRLDTGDILRAKVIDAKSGEATLRLYDGSLLKAAITDEFSAKEGQNITLTVSARSEGTIYLEIVKNTDAATIDSESVKKSLDTLQVKADNINVQLASELTRAGITIDKQIMDKARELMNSFKEIDALKAAFIAAKGLGSGTDGIEQLVKLLGGDLKLGEQLSVLKELFANLSKITDGQHGELQNSINSPTDVFGDRIFLNDANVEAVRTAGIAQKGTVSAGSIQTGLAQGASASQAAVQGQTSAESANTAASTHGAVQNSPGVTTNFENAATKAAGASQTGAASEASASQAAVQGQTSAESANTAASTQGSIQNSPGTTAASEHAAAQAAGASQTVTVQSSGAANAPYEELSVKQQSINTSENGQQISNGNGNIGKKSDNSINSLHMAADRNSDNKATVGLQSSNIESSLINMDDEVLRTTEKTTLNNNDNTTYDTHGLSYKERIGDEIQQLFIDTDSPELSHEINIREVENKIEEKLGNIKVLIKSSNLSAAEGRSINQATGSVAASVRVLSHLNNNNMIYYQLPLNMHGYNTTAELYVMKRNKRQRKIDPSNNVMFISLDTQRMGRVETLLDVKDKNICINIRTENERINAYLKENVKELYNGLSICGYKLASIKYSLIDSPSDPIEQERLLKGMLSYEHGKVDLRI